MAESRSRNNSNDSETMVALQVENGQHTSSVASDELLSRGENQNFIANSQPPLKSTTQELSATITAATTGLATKEDIIALLPETAVQDLFNTKCQQGPLEVIKLFFSDERIDPKGWEDRHVDDSKNGWDVQVVQCYIPIDVASNNQQHDIVRVLLTDERVNPEAHSHFALLYSCWVGDIVQVRKILKKIKLDPKHDHTSDIICRPCYMGHTEIVSTLLDDGRIDPSAAYSEEEKPIYIAAVNGRCEIVHALTQDERVNPGLSKNFAFIYYCMAGDTTRVQTLLTNASVGGFEDGLALAHACKNGRVSVAELLLVDPRIDPSVDGNKAVLWACMEGRYDVVKVLLTDKRADPSVFNNRAIIESSDSGFAKMVELLLSDSRVDPTAQNNMALQLAMDKSYDDVVKMLLGDSRVIKSGGEQIVLEFASTHGQLEIIRWVLARPGVLVTRSSLVAAEFNGQGKTSRLLISEQPLEVWKRCQEGCSHRPDGPLRRELDRWEASSANVFLHSIKRTQTPIVAARMADVLRKVLDEYARFLIVGCGPN